MRRLRLVLPVLLAAGGALWLPLTAHAHALAQSSNPSDGAILQQAPQLVMITFGEAPDPRLSSIRILDSSGREHQQGATQAVAGSPLQLRVAMGPAPNGVYTVSWRTISSVDGHLASGSFAFGIGVSPAGASRGGTQPAPQIPSPTPLSVAGRWLLFAGLASLLGLSFVALVVLRETPRSALPLAIAAEALVLAGTVAVIEAQRADAGLPYSQLLATSLGRISAARAIPALVIALAVALAALGHGARRRVAIALVGAGAAGGMLVDVSSSHAAAGSQPLLNGLVQWIHVVAVGVWMGGLLALLLSIRGAEGPEKARAARRFSTVAGVALVVVAITGVVRAVVEIGAWSRLATTTFGVLVLIKVGLILVLALLGAVNRYRNVPVTLRRLRPLRRVGTAELVVGAGAILTAAGLVNVPPPAYAAGQAPPPPQQVVATGADFGTTVRVRLEVTPGTAGFNQFVLRASDYDSGKEVRADQVSLRFSLPSRPDVGSSTIDLRPAGNGSYQATGTNLSLDGSWRVDAFLQRGARSTQVSLMVRTRTVPPQIDIARARGQPTLYTIHLPLGRKLQVYLDPGAPGANEFHATFFDASGNELPVDQATISLTASAGPPVVLPSRELESGHFVADVTVAKGKNGFDIVGTARSGDQLSTHIDIDVGS